jgi:hypothetical protein
LEQYYNSEGISNGTFLQALLDDKVVCNVIGWLYTELNAGLQPENLGSEAYVDVRANHYTTIRISELLFSYS